jgi:hypothetical protein
VGTYPSPTLTAAGTAGTYTKVTTDTKGRVTSGTTLSASDIPAIAQSQVTNLSTSFAAKADLVGGFVPQSQIPAVAITDTFVVASQAAMLALTAQTGDVAVRTDLSKSFILKGSDPTVLANWQELLSPSGYVTAVSGTAPVVSSGGATPSISVTVGQVANTVAAGDDSRFSNSRIPTAHASTHASGGSDAVTIAESQVTGLVTDLGLKSPLASPTFTGTPASVTAAVNTNTTQIATTAFVVGQAATATPLVDGTAAVGTSLLYARQDHIHGTDTSRAPAASPTFSGTVTVSPFTTAGFVKNSAAGALSSAVIASTDLPTVAGLTTGTPFANATVTVDTYGRVTAVAAGTTAVLSVAGTSGSVTVTGSTTPVISLTAAYGDSVNPYGSKTANLVLASPNGSAAAPTFRALVEADVTNLVSDLALKAPLASPTFTGTVTAPLTTAGVVTTTSGGVLSSVATVPYGYLPVGTAASTIAAGNDARLTGMPQLAKTASYTLALADAGYHIYFTGSTASQTITIPLNSSIAFPIGSVITIVNLATVSLGIAITAGDSLYLAGTGLKTPLVLAANGMATLLKVENQKWIASGNGLS